MAQHDPLGLCPGRILLEHFELNLALLEHVVLVDRHLDRQHLLVVPDDLVVFDVGFGREATMFARDGRGEMPSYVGLTGDEGDIVEIKDLKSKLEFGTSVFGNWRWSEGD